MRLLPGSSGGLTVGGCCKYSWHQLSDEPSRILCISSFYVLL